MNPTRVQERILLVSLLLLLGLFVAWPQVRVLVRVFFDEAGFTLDPLRRVFDLSRPANLVALWNSAWLSAASVLLAGGVGTGLAFLVDRAGFPLRKTLSALCVLPLFLPPIVGVLAFKQFLLGEYGLLPRITAAAFGVRVHLEGFAGILVLHTYVFFPLFFLFVVAARRRVDPSLPDAAASLGARAPRILRRVWLPLLRPALVGAGILVLLNAMGSFSAPLFFAPTEEILTLRIYLHRESDPASVAVLASILAAAAFALLLPLRRIEGRTEVVSSRPAAGAARPVRGARRKLATALALFLALLLLLPHLSLLLLSFADESRRSNAILPTLFTLDHYRGVLARGTFVGPLLHSLRMATLAAAVDVVLGLAVAWLLSRPRLPGRRLLEVLAFLPMAVPATVLAFDLLETFSRAGPLTFGHALAGTWILLPIAYFVRHLPIAVRATQSALASLDATLVDAARSLGAGSWTAFRRIVLPILSPGVVAGGLLCFLGALSEFVASILLYVPENKPIAVEIYDAFYNGTFGEPAALSVLLLLVQSAAAFFAHRLLRAEPALEAPGL